MTRHRAERFRPEAGFAPIQAASGNSKSKPHLFVVQASIAITPKDHLKHGIKDNSNGKVIVR